MVKIVFCKCALFPEHRGSVADIATRYGLEFLGFEPKWGQKIVFSPYPTIRPASFITGIGDPCQGSSVRGVALRYASTLPLCLLCHVRGHLYYSCFLKLIYRRLQNKLISRSACDDRELLVRKAVNGDVVCSKVCIKPPPERAGKPQHACHAMRPSERGHYVPHQNREELNKSVTIVQVEEQKAAAFRHCYPCRPSIPFD
jgi:hypothetical protein